MPDKHCHNCIFHYFCEVAVTSDLLRQDLYDHDMKSEAAELMRIIKVRAEKCNRFSEMPETK